MLTTELTSSETSLDKKNTALSDIKHCENCKAPLSGPFCANCGQEADSTLKYFWRVILHLLDDIFSFDSRASRTLVPLIARPAFLTNEYFAGRRVHYVPPLRLYLFISIVFFITLKFFVASNSSVNSDNDNKAVIEQVNAHIKELEKQQLELKKVVNSVSVEEAVLTEQAIANNDVKMQKLAEDIVKFNGYLTDLNRVDEEGSDQKIIKITKELVAFEFDKATADLSDEEQQEVAKLLSKRDGYLAGKDLGESFGQFTIGNKEDGSLRFDFLSDESNKKLEKFSKDFSGKAEKAFNSDTGPLIDQVIGKLPQLMFILLPLFAVLLKVMFIFSKRLYMEHLTVALHSHSFIFITLLLMTMLDGFYDYLIPTSPDIANLIETAASAILVWIPIYLFIMQKRVYKQGYFITLVKYAIIGVMYNIMISVAGLIALVWGIMGT
jgi:molybdopterin converting factor small subunit